MRLTKILISPVKTGFFAQKRPNLARNWHFCSFWVRPCRLIWCPVGGLVGGCGVWTVLRKTPIYFIIVFSCTKDRATLLLPSISKTSFPVDNENLSDVDVVTIVFSCTKARATSS